MVSHPPYLTHVPPSDPITGPSGSGEPKQSSLSLRGGGNLFASAPVPGPINGKKVALLRAPQAESLFGFADAKEFLKHTGLEQVDAVGGSKTLRMM